MQEVAKEFVTEIEVRDEREIITTDTFEIHFFPDDRGFSFITCKIFDSVVEETLEKIISKYQKKT
ncbi:MAG: hypothetical protein ACXAC8_07860 [Candidatus Hodarchaeales archaeon]|jgi:hypothetical protein